MKAGSIHFNAVCLDGRNLNLRHGTGVATYAATLAAGLHVIGRSAAILLDALPGADPAGGRVRRRLRAAWPGAIRSAPLAPPPGFSRAWLAPDVFRLAQVHFDIHGRLLTVQSCRPPALMHWTYPLPLIFKGTTNLYTIHDLIPLRYPNLTNIDSFRFARIVSQLARRADHIVTVSEKSRRDVIELLGVPEERVTNTYQPVFLPIPLSRARPPLRHGHFLYLRYH